MTSEEAEVLRRAQAIVAAALEQPLTCAPMKVDCIEMRCNPADEETTRAAFDAPIVVDPTVKPGTLQVIPLGYAVSIKAEIGFVNPGPTHDWQRLAGTGWVCTRCLTLKRVQGAGELSTAFEYRKKGLRAWRGAEPPCVASPA